MRVETILTNARVVTRDATVHGTLVARDGKIADLDDRPSTLPDAIDLEGDLLLPGLIDVHTDALERHLEPRPEVFWPTLAALLIHDRQMVAAGVTTVFDSLYVGTDQNFDARQAALIKSFEAMERAQADGLLKSDHFLHLRCELPSDGLIPALEGFIDDPFVRLVSVMDHTPGQRQWADLDKWYLYHSRTKSRSELDALHADRRERQAVNYAPNRRAVIALARARGLPLASHDDTTLEHVAEAVNDGVTISEFPTSLEAARAAHAAGLGTIMGGPNVVMGGSHSGNAAARAVAAAGALDGLASDYVPMSLIQAAFLLHDEAGTDLAAAVATVSAEPARMVGLTDRGEILPGRRADLLWVKDYRHVPVIRAVWRAGERVM